MIKKEEFYSSKGFECIDNKQYEEAIECGNAIYVILFMLMDMHKKDNNILSIEGINEKLKLLIEL